MLTSLLRCRACGLTWFPNGGAGAACPACGGAKVGGTFELFHVGLALIALALFGWMGPMILGERPGAAVPASIQAKELTADVVKDRRGNQVYVSSNKVKSTKVKKRQKAKKRSQHVQR